MEHWKIKLLSGMYNDVEIPLHDGDIIVGSDEEIADIVLSDLNIKNKHFVFEVSEEKVSIVQVDPDIEKEIYLNHKKKNNEDTLVLEPNDFVRIGKLKFMFGKIDDVLEKEIDSEEDTQNIKEVIVEKEKTAWFKSILIALVLSIIPIIFLGYALYQSDVEKKQYINQAEPIVQVRDVISAFNLDNVRVEWDGTQNKVNVKGYVITNIQKSKILNSIEQLNINYTSDIHVIDNIQRVIRFLLINYGYNQIQVEAGEEPGTVVLTGSIQDSSKWQDFEQVLRQEVPGLISWELNVIKTEEVMSFLKELLYNFELSNKVTLHQDVRKIEISGVLTQKEVESFYELKKEFVNKYKDSIQLVLNSTRKKEKQVQVDFVIKAVNFGEHPYIILSDNVRYIEGSRTPSGFTILKISEFGVDFAKQNQVIYVDFGGIKDVGARE